MGLQRFFDFLKAPPVCRLPDPRFDFAGRYNRPDRLKRGARLTPKPLLRFFAAMFPMMFAIKSVATGKHEFVQRRDPLVGRAPRQRYRRLGRPSVPLLRRPSPVNHSRHEYLSGPEA